MRGSWMIAFVVACASSGERTEPPQPDAAPVASCGDGVCAATEIGACSTDCGAVMATCGNGACESGESMMSCPGDCASVVCGDGTCSGPTETSANCPGDCTGSSATCGNAVCEPGENMATCPGDCPTSASCGNALCEAGEDATTCPLDCSSASTCPGGDDVGCFFCWFDPTMCIPPQTEQLCAACLGL